MRLLIAFATGALFGLGLLASGMTDTTKVQAWLDIFGAWDPTLAFVLGGAIVPMAVAWPISRRMTRPVAGGAFPGPARAGMGRDLALGSLLFGLGWGLVGLCPGPAIASLSFGGWSGIVFFSSMCAGMLAAPLVGRKLVPA